MQPPPGKYLKRDNQEQDISMTALATLADRVDQAFEQMTDEVEKILLAKVKALSLAYPSRSFRISSGHGSLELQVSLRSRAWNRLTGHQSYFAVDYEGEGRTAPDGFAEDLFREVDDISRRFQNQYNGYACIQVDYTFINGELVSPKKQ
jgi:hypothetical protein